jgi:hypothetical protein
MIFNDYESFLQNCETNNCELHVMGDFNCDVTKSSPDYNTRRLQFLSTLYQLDQIINEPTRVTITSASLIDLFFTNKRQLKIHIVQQLKIHIQNIPIKQVFQCMKCKTLGVTVDENLCWKSNIDTIYVKRYHLEYTLSKALKNMLIKKHSFPYTML